jgi:hypothetical protein
MSSSDEEPDEEEEELENEEEDVIKNVPEDITEYNPLDDDYIMEPEDWTGWMNYNEEVMKFHYEDLYDFDCGFEYYDEAEKIVEERLERWKSKEGLDDEDSYYIAVFEENFEISSRKNSTVQ